MTGVDSAGTGNALEVVGLTKRFGSTLALDGASLSVRPGEVHALFGGNGSGKSTFIKILAGVHRAEPGGTITVKGVTAPSNKWSGELARAAGVRFVHQDLGLFPSLSVAENLVANVGYPHGRSGRIHWREVNRRAAALMAEYEIGLPVRRPVAGLRPADQALVAILRVLRRTDGDPTVLFLDEPTAALPEHEVDILFAAVRRFAAAGTAIVYVTHRFAEIQRLAQRVTVLRDGRAVSTVDTKDTSKEQLSTEISDRDAAPIAAGNGIALPSDAGRSTAPVLAVSSLVADPLRSVDLEVGRGEVVGLAGLLGSGRSSLLRAVFGTAQVRSGSMQLNGVPWQASGPAHALRNGVSLLPETRAEYGYFDHSIRANLLASTTRSYWRLGRFQGAREKRDAEQAVSRYLIRCRDIDAPLSTLSGGNQQKVLLARCLLINPTLLLLDEPTQGVDINARAEIWSILRERRADGLSILLASSDLEELIEHSDRIIILNRGRVVSAVQADGLTTESLNAMMLDDARTVA